MEFHSSFHNILKRPLMANPPEIGTLYRQVNHSRAALKIFVDQTSFLSEINISDKVSVSQFQVVLNTCLAWSLKIVKICEMLLAALSCRHGLGCVGEVSAAAARPVVRVAAAPHQQQPQLALCLPAIIDQVQAGQSQVITMVT